MKNTSHKKKRDSISQTQKERGINFIFDAVKPKKEKREGGGERGGGVRVKRDAILKKNIYCISTHRHPRMEEHWMVAEWNEEQRDEQTGTTDRQTARGYKLIQSVGGGGEGLG